MHELSHSDELIQKTQHVISVLRKHRALLVALSGGVDSAVLLALACRAIGSENVVAFTGRSGAVTDEEIDDAARVAAFLGVSHAIVDTNEIDDPGYRANEGNRCFYCRSELFRTLSQYGDSRGIRAVAYGAIVDDLSDDRPGMRAAEQFGALAPLVDAGICKIEVRQLAKTLGLHVQDKPSNACLASRIPMGTEVTPERLEQVRGAERAIRRLGFRQVRVRHHGQLARIEVAEDELDRLSSAETRPAVVAAVREAGFRFVTLDLVAYRPSGLHSIEPLRAGGQ